MTYKEWESARRYSVVRSHRGIEPDIWERVELSELTWEQATKKAAELSEAERILHPEQTSWTRDLFHPRLDTPQWVCDRTPKPSQLEMRFGKADS